MTLEQLNEELNFNFDSGLVAYLDKSTGTFNFEPDRNKKNRGLTSTILNKNDYNNLKKNFDIDVSVDDWKYISNKAKKKNKDPEFRKALSAMQRDIFRK